MNAPHKLDLETAEKLLDVVFGVIIGLSLLQLPLAIANVVTAFSITELNRTILLSTGLFYGAFYWLETRHFILKQNLFNVEIKKIDEENRDGVPLPLASFLMGILGLMGFASAQLSFADQGDFLKFSYAAALFWAFDIFGTFQLKKEYRKEGKKLNLTDRNTTEGERWYVGHIESSFFYFWGFGNLLVFATGIFIIQIQGAPKYWEPILCGFYLVVTLFRHLYVRSYLFEKVTTRLENKLVQQSAADNADKSHT